MWRVLLLIFTLEQHACDDPRRFDNVVLNQIVQRGVTGRRALQAKAHQELVQRNVDAMVVLSGRSVRSGDEVRTARRQSHERPDIFNDDGK